MKVSVKNLDNKDVGNIDLDNAVFGVEFRSDILSRMVNWQLAKRRAGTHKTRGISEIRGTTAKPWRQKGSGRARSGSIRSPQFRGGAVIFGPMVRCHNHKLPKKVRKLAMKTALSAKQAEGKLIVLDSTKLAKPKTSDLIKHLTKFGLGRALVIDGVEVNENFSRAAANLRGIDVLPHQGINVYDILRCDTLVLTRDAVSYLQERLK
ncbi:MAG: 50S ribosomal protein L4 [Alphaproteobacteria bacterium]|jgi:large subunit ribosomal protein L4|nr:50S ribosomal protein L4 [Alphaproteobacteria bacterium]MDP7183165.1 50S ribosomal protein L4 [Alphaproteobacteria bacterium]MDP7191225.1 50S ribosomal protein L4 [Alphaproteobacteria bacterium]MDP7456488.1 50S ribosomal protein L4 [Alphaproteobacteria bacterium]HJO89355.1 50S ribosomal protein L4 [Alphaproteobacteria bacterium]|tara:strand:- start:1210 stop:1830 length:621 start_codon:yes stop_codon:yes gene_type:complete